jgi:hypothetical protein
MKTIRIAICYILLSVLISFGNNEDDIELKVILENTYPLSSISPTDTDFEDLLFLADILQDKRVVILGEAGH